MPPRPLPRWDGSFRISCFLWNSLKKDLLSFQRARERIWRVLSPTGSPGIAVNLADLLRIYPKRAICSLAKQDNCLGQTSGCWCRVTRMGGVPSPARVCLGNNYLASFESKIVLRTWCVYRDQIQCMVSVDSFPFRKLFIDKAAGPDSQLPYGNCSLLSENKPTRQELLLLLLIPLPFGEWSVLCPTYIIPKTWGKAAPLSQGRRSAHCSFLSFLSDMASLSSLLRMSRSKGFDGSE